MTHTEERVLKCMKSINSLVDVNLFFDLLARLIQDLKITRTDPRLSLYARIDQNPNELLANVCTRKIFILYNRKNINYLAFAVYEQDFLVIKEQISGLTQLGEAFVKDARQALLCTLTVPDFNSQSCEPLIQAWLQHAQDHLQTQKASQFRGINITWLYEMATDIAVRKAMFLMLEKVQLSAEKFAELIAQYQKIVSTDNNEPERYKWTCVQHFQENWNIDAPDFGAMLKSALNKMENLLYLNSSDFILKIVDSEPEQIRYLFKDLFDESRSLDGRVELFQKGAIILQKRENEARGENRNHQQDERTISFYLAMRFPETYPIYKKNVYDYLRSFFPSAAVAPVNKRFAHFIRLGRKLLPLISKNKALKEQVLQTLKSGDWQGPQDWLIFQDVLFRTLMLKDKRDLPANEDLEETAEPTPKIMHPTMPLISILYGPTGTGKTYTTLEKAVQCAVPYFLPAGNTDREKRDSYRAQYDALVAEGRIRFVTFHQSFSYEDFIEGIKPVMEERPVLIEDEAQSTSLGYEIRRGIFREICEAARQPAGNNFGAAWQSLQRELTDLDGEKLILTTPSQKRFAIDLNSRGNFRLYTGDLNKSMGSLTKDGVALQFEHGNYYKWWVGYYDSLIEYLKKFHGLKELIPTGNTKPYVLIIDEINRGNVSQIFGELVTLLEEDKRAGGKEALSVQLPYSGDTFSVPSNLYIIGTMNTADRSVEALDTALRRRFAFEEMPPRPDLLRGKTVLVNGSSYDLGALLQTLNARMEVLAGRDHKIGHSYFLNLPPNDWKALHAVFNRSIIPLLQEYFWGDYSRMCLVLGTGFLELQTPASNLFPALPAGSRAADNIEALTDKEVWHLRNLLTEEAFAEALDILLN